MNKVFTRPLTRIEFSLVALFSYMFVAVDLYRTFVLGKEIGETETLTALPVIIGYFGSAVVSIQFIRPFIHSKTMRWLQPLLLWLSLLLIAYRIRHLLF